MRRVLIGCALAGMIFFVSPAGAEDSSAGSDAGHDWNLNSYLKGSTGQVRDSLNGEVERLVQKLRETKSSLEACDKDIANDTKAAVEKLHKSAEYRQTLAEKNRDEQELQTARKSGTPQERLDAGSRFNKARATLEKMENDAVNKNDTIAQDRNRSYDIQREQKRYKEALIKALGWRNELLHALRSTFAMRGPVQEGSKGSFPEATVVKILDVDHAIIKFEAMELMTKGAEKEGIQSFTARAYHTTVLVSGIDTRKFKQGDKIDIDHVYVIDGREHTEDRGTIYTAKRVRNDVDVLLETIVPLREPIPAGISPK